MKTRITILCENSVIVPFGVIGEHGFAAFVETENGNFLFDTGQGKGILQNADILGKDLSTIKYLVISHGHYDHTLGIPQVLLKKSPLDIYAHPDIFLDRFWIKDNMPPKFIGIPYKQSYLESLGANFKFIKDFTEIEKGIFLSGEVPRKTDYEKVDQNMKLLIDGKYQQDNLKDDYSLAIKTSKGLVILLGCAHAGMVNILNYFIEKTGVDKIYAVIGGTHLGFATDEQIENTLKVLDKYNIEKLGVSHCTGLAISAKLFNILKDRFFFASVGAIVEI
jgi:7,8-dihydropterin-6-yl-methyl-4-(beta-D-ribofuranosyl)aminobenzene 5'-phosphate synthase